MATVTAHSLVPPVRLGRLLRERREASGLTLAELAAVSHHVSCSLLEDVEAGRVDLSERVLRRVTSLYGVDVAQLVPTRMQLVIDLDAGRLSLAGDNPDRVGTDGSVPTSPEPVLVRYLALLYATRGMPVGAPLPLRRSDIDALAEALSLEGREVQRRLRALMLESDRRVERTVRTLRRRLVVPMVGVLVAVTAAGTLLLVGGDPPAGGDAPEQVADRTPAPAPPG
jgi:transcriptional regulator with XRE-family HTH domain